MRILIVDTNIVYANKVKEFIESYGKSIADIAYNKPIIFKRLNEHKYDLIIIDYEFAKRSEILDELEHINVQKIIWSMNPVCKSANKDICMLNKPACEKEISRVFSELPEVVQCVHSF